MTKERFISIGTELMNAEATRTPVPPLAERFQLSVDSAYAVQLLWAEEQVKKGRKLVGYKVGLTSKAAQKHFKVFEPDFGHLFEDMQVKESVSTAVLIQPKIEGEIAFRMAKNLKGPGVTFEQAAEAIEGACAAIEIIDSRIQDWKISAADTIADNGSSARFVLGTKWIRVPEKEFPTLGMAFSVNNEVVFSGAGAAVMEHPLWAVVFLANALGKYDVELKAGQIILSGALSGMASMKKGEHYRCEIWKLGDAEVKAV